MVGGLLRNAQCAKTCAGVEPEDEEDLDAAVAIAAQGPVARVGTVEVRPVREGPPTDESTYRGRSEG